MGQFKIRIAVIAYPGVLQSSVHGFQEMFSLSNRICAERKLKREFSVDILTMDEIRATAIGEKALNAAARYQAIILPPSIGSPFCSARDLTLSTWLLAQHSAGAILCSVCAGAFILASTGLLQNRPVTTHWSMAAEFSRKFPAADMASEKILIDDGDIVTAGGIMAWVDLGLELVARFTDRLVMRELGKVLVVDTGLREQRYYQSFIPVLHHGDKAILKAQHYLQTHFNQRVKLRELAELSCLGERTFFRHFLKATALKPLHYIQKLRVQKACELLENSDLSFDRISQHVGYEDVSAFRKVFIKTVGLTPRDFKKRFALR